MTKLLKEDLLEGLPVVRRTVPDGVAIERLCYSSKEVGPGTVFFALRGASVDGHDFIPAAIKAGAAAIVAETPQPDDVTVPWVQVHDTRRVMAGMAAHFYGNPSHAMKVAGVTGTNGKTTIAFLLHYLLREGFRRAGMLGTVHYDLGDDIRPASHTTPESVEIQRLLATMRETDCRAVVMEVSSHALTQHRVDDVEFDVGIFTNLTQDHLDYHGTMEEYHQAKALLGHHLHEQRQKRQATFIINKDDSAGQRLIREFNDKVAIVTYGMGVGCDYRASEIRMNFHGTTFQLEAKGRSFLVRTPLIGRYNVYNALAALAGANVMKLNLREAVHRLEDAPQVPGRLESIMHSGGFKVFIDYAHTPDALENMLKTLRALNPLHLICVFGCGGDRDRAKRPLMAAAAERNSDYVIITSDNPRSEDPQAILKDVAKGFRGDQYEMEVDRRLAIRAAVDMAENRDIVVIAGKGHEATQQFATETVVFDDRDEAAKALSLRDFKPNHRNGGGR